MTKMIVEVPDQLHRMIKSLAGANGESIKAFVLRGIEQVIKSEAKISVKKPNGNYISEEEADKLLKPVIMKYINQINAGKLELYSKKEFFKKLKN